MDFFFPDDYISCNSTNADTLTFSYNKICYKVVSETKTYFEAAAKCGEENGSLAIILSEDEQVPTQNTLTRSISSFHSLKIRLRNIIND